MIKHYMIRGLLCFLLPLVVLLNGCSSKEKVLYLQDVDDNLTKEVLTYKTTIQPDDLLLINVSSIDMTAVVAYNKNTFIDKEGSIVMVQENENSGYLVDSQGDILFPELGKLHVAGMTNYAVVDLLTSKLKKFVVEPTVDVRIANFKVTVLGEVTRPGTFDLASNRVTIPQALGLAGDLTIFGDRKSVLLLRDDNGTQITKRIDLTTADFINSEFYFLRQNDVLIISPNETRAQGSRFNQNTSLYVSIASVLLTTAVILITSK
jgi:polysaccharide export outer membrane protein